MDLSVWALFDVNAHQGTSTDEGLSDQLDRVADSVHVSQAPSKLPQGWLSRLVEHGRCGRDRAMHIQWELTNMDFPSPRPIWLLSRLNA